jgi:hypothetical protein
MTYGFDIRALVKSIIDKVLEIDLLLVFCMDSKLLYECLVKLGTTQEKRLIIDVIAFIRHINKWIKGESNLANTIIKSKSSNALKRLIDTNTL